MTKIFADGASIAEILELNKDDMIEGFTTNPTLMKKAGVTNYEGFAREIISWIDIRKPISFEVLSEDYSEMKRQAIKIASWGKNVYVKIPVTDTKGNPNYELMRELSLSGINVNATAITDTQQISRTAVALNTNTPSIISVFAGRIADTNVHPWTIMAYAVKIKRDNQEILWASSREPYNYLEARDLNVDIITLTTPIYKKLKEQWHKDLAQLSLETVQMFYNDAKESGLTL